MNYHKTNINNYEKYKNVMISKPQKIDQHEIKTKKKHTIKKINMSQFSNNGVDLDFLNNSIDNKMILSIGNKGSGKTTTLLNYLKLAFENNFFDCYFLILPVFEHEINDSYRFIKEHKGKEQIYIFNEWDTDIILDKIKDKKFEKSFICVDDSTGHFNAFIQDLELIKFISTMRHFNCSMWVITHSIRRNLPTTMRALIDILLIYKTSSKLSLEIIFDEYLSLMFNNLKEWINYFKENVINKDDYSGLYINIRDHKKIMGDVSDFKFMN